MHRRLAILMFLQYAVAGAFVPLFSVSQPLPVFWTCFALWFFLVPVLTLGVSLSFRQLAHPERDFGRVRMWGTVGWIMPGLALGYWFSDPPWLIDALAALTGAHGTSAIRDGLRLGGSLALVLAAYALTLPHTPPVSAPHEP